MLSGCSSGPLQHLRFANPMQNCVTNLQKLASPKILFFYAGSVIVFVALLSTSFVGRTINRNHWCGIGFIILGLVIVGWSDMSSTSSDKDTNSIITGKT